MEHHTEESTGNLPLGKGTSGEVGNFPGMAFEICYVTGDKTGPLVKLYYQFSGEDCELHLHMDSLGEQVLGTGTFKVGGKNSKAPNVHTACTMFKQALKTAKIQYHQWLRQESSGKSWTLGCGRQQEDRMRGQGKPPYDHG